MRFRRLAPAAFALALTLPAFAAEPSTLDANYTIAFWAVPFGHTSYQGKFAGGGYSAGSHFETSGVVSVFWNSIIDATVSGHISGRDVHPAVYDSYTRRSSKKVQQVKVTFDGAMPSTYANPAYNTTKYPVTDEQKKGSVDPMSAISTILAGVTATDANPCGSGVRVFDGRRRYDVLFTYLKDVPAKMDNGLFNGTAHLCQIHYNEIAGYKQKILKEGEALPQMFAWFVDVPAKGAPNGRYVVAIKLWSTLSLGTVTATLDNLKVDGGAAQFKS
ncbi:MAG TPA: DUF3108 domain-containing protein [Rhizomicrobium sp.]|jgi:hypothetical protein|nr:DUF3108 domain-containing protein [Rhizomicrobium sp.]